MSRYSDRRLPQQGEVWERAKDGKRVRIASAPQWWWGFVRLLWLDTDRHTHKRCHYFLDEFSPTDSAVPEQGEPTEP